MIPVIPGPPVYLFGGLICVKSFKQDTPLGFWGGMVVTIFLATILKVRVVNGRIVTA
jgi:hypothetical protein